MKPHTLLATGLSAGYGETRILDGLDLAVPPGRITVIVGANACGKSTLLRTLSRLLPAQRGQVLLDGKSIHRIPSRDLARTLGLLPQSPIAPEGITVADLVSRGRHPHQGVFSRWTREDDVAVAAALAATKTDDHVGRGIVGMRERAALYGGELVAGPDDAGAWSVHLVLPGAGA